MQKLLYILFLLTIGICIYSCDDSLGVEKNVRKTLISDNTPDTVIPPPPPNIRLECDSFKFTVDYERLYDSIPNQWPIEWSDSLINPKIKATLDTSNGNSILWLSFDVENKYEWIYPKDAWHVRSLTFKIDSLSIITGDVIQLNTDMNAGRWSALIMEKLPGSSDWITYSISTSPVAMSIQNIFPRKGTCRIDSYIYFTLNSRYAGYTKIEFKADLNLFFNYK